MKLDQLDTRFINAMARAMYDFEAGLHAMPDLLNDAEVLDFFMSYLGA